MKMNKKMGKRKTTPAKKRSLFQRAVSKIAGQCGKMRRGK